MRRKKVNKTSQNNDDVINPLNFFDLVGEEKKTEVRKPVKKKVSVEKVEGKQGQGFCVVGTGFGCGKTIGVCILGALMKNQGCSVGFMKVVECGGESSSLLLTAFGMDESREDVSPFFLPFDLPPQEALRRRRTKFNMNRIVDTYKKLIAKYDYVFVESCGGLMTPITESISTQDVVKTLGADVIIVGDNSSSSLNHVLLTAAQIQGLGVKVKGTVFSCRHKDVSDKVAYDSARAVFRKCRITSIGVVPFLEKISRNEVNQKCRGKVNTRVLTGEVQPVKQTENNNQTEARKKRPQYKKPARPRRFVKRQPKPKQEEPGKSNG